MNREMEGEQQWTERDTENLAHKEQGRAYELGNLRRELDRENVGGIDRPAWAETLHETSRYSGYASAEALAGIFQDAEKLRSKKAEIDAQSREHLGSIEDQARRYVDQWEGYGKSQADMAAELGVAPRVENTSSFIDEVARIDAENPDDRAEILAVMDLIAPLADENKAWGNLEISSWNRVPRVGEIVSPESAALEAENKGYTAVLRITTKVDRRVGGWRSDVYAPASQTERYLPVGPKTLEALKKAGKDNLDTSFGLYTPGIQHDWPTMEGDVHIEYDVLPVEALKKERAKQHATLEFEVADMFGDGKSETRSVLIDGFDEKQIFHKAASQLRDIEMDDQNPAVLVKNVTVEIDGKKVPWEEFMAEQSKAA